MFANGRRWSAFWLPLRPVSVLIHPAFVSFLQKTCESNADERAFRKPDKRC
jgi:hypothetical protein